MSYLTELQEAHKARMIRLGGKTPKIEPVAPPAPPAPPPVAVIEVQPPPKPAAPIEVITIPRSAHASYMFSRDVIRIVCAAFNVQPYQIMAKDRRSPLCQARQVAVYLMKKHSGMSWMRIGQMLGGYDTSSLRHSRCKIREKICSDPRIMSIVASVEREIAELHHV
jgi:Bacterial dnaA protein helix-turn-helix